MENLYAIATRRVAPLAAKTAKGGSRPGHVWIASALRDYICEGLTPFSDRATRRYARGCLRVIRQGEKFLRKGWITFEGCEISSRHCPFCAPAVELSPVRIRT